MDDNAGWLVIGTVRISREGFDVEREFFLVWTKCPFTVLSTDGQYLVSFLYVNPVHVFIVTSFNGC